MIKYLWIQKLCIPSHLSALGESKEMKAAPNPQHLDRFCQPRSRSRAASFKFTALLSTGLVAASFLGAAPSLGQTATVAQAPNETQNLTCVTEGQRLLCEVQKIGQAPKTIAFEQKPHAGKASQTLELTPVTSTALISPELDERIANVLLWAFYLSFPASAIAAVWCYDRRAREQTAVLVQNIAALERIWQRPQTR